MRRGFFVLTARTRSCRVLPTPMITMNTRRRNLDILQDLKNTRTRRLRFRGENRYRRHPLGPSLSERLQRTLEDLANLFLTYRRRSRGNTYRHGHRRLTPTSPRTLWARELSKS